MYTDVHNGNTANSEHNANSVNNENNGNTVHTVPSVSNARKCVQVNTGDTRGTGMMAMTGNQGGTSTQV